MPNDFMLKSMNAAHRAILKLSGGKVGWTASNMAVLELTTIGNKSGQPRSVMLTSPYEDGDSMVIVASKGGEDTHPAWFLNLRAEPEVKVAYKGGAAKPMVARTLSGDERTTIWDQLTAEHKNYAGYQSKTDREIPVVMLDPA